MGVDASSVTLKEKLFEKTLVSSIAVIFAV